MKTTAEQRVQWRGGIFGDPLKAWTALLDDFAELEARLTIETGNTDAWRTAAAGGLERWNAWQEYARKVEAERDTAVKQCIAAEKHCDQLIEDASRFETQLTTLKKSALRVVRGLSRSRSGHDPKSVRIQANGEDELDGFDLLQQLADTLKKIEG